MCCSRNMPRIICGIMLTMCICSSNTNRNNKVWSSYSWPSSSSYYLWVRSSLTFAGQFHWPFLHLRFHLSRTDELGYYQHRMPLYDGLDWIRCCLPLTFAVSAVLYYSRCSSSFLCCCFDWSQQLPPILVTIR